jgi:hypothetical protein
VRVAERDDPTGEGMEVILQRVEMSVVPGEIVVLAVRVVVSLLGAADLVATEDHRHAL